MNIFGGTTGLMQQMLDLRAAQHQVTISNIANEETPDSHANELRFTEALAAARRSQPVTLQVSHSHHLSVPGAGIQGYISKVSVGDLPLDSNSVNIDLEMAKLSENAMHYKMTAELLQRKFRGLSLSSARGDSQHELTRRRRSRKFTPMHFCPLKHLQRLPVWSVLFLWLFMGSVALAEQVDLMTETSTQDEQALEALQQAIKPGQTETTAGPVGIGPLDPVTEVAGVPFLLSRLRVNECRPLFNSKSTIRLFMILSCYRI